MKKPVEITPEFLQKCVQDDRKAVQSLYEYCFKMLMPVCYRYHSHEEDARSSFNLGFIKILKSLEAIGEDVNFVGWSKRIMVNTLIDEYRKSKNYSSRVSSRESDWELEVQGQSFENDGESSMGYEVILKMVSELPELSGKVFNLYVIEGYSHKEIGELLEMSEGTSKWHLSTARRMLRERIEKVENNISDQNKRMVI